MTTRPDALAAFLRRARLDPVFFCRRALGVRPWAKQVAVLEALRDHPRVAVRSGHGTGKSFIAASAALWFLYAFYPSKVVTTAPTWNQVRIILWNEIRRQHARAPLPLGGAVLEEAIKLGPDAFAVGLSTDEPERFQGYHAEHLLVILDEAPGVRPEVWEAAETLLTSAGSKMLAIGNPTRPAGRFYQAFAPASGWARIHISCLDSPNLDESSRPYPGLVTRAWIEEKRRQWGEASPLYQARVLGEFPEEGAGALLPRRLVEAAAKRTAGPPDPATTSLGVDVARTGADATVLCLRDRRGVRHLEAHHGWSTMETAGRVAQLLREGAVAAERVYIDDTGLGAGVTDRLIELGHAVRPVVLGARASDSEHFANVRAECYWRLREALLGQPAPSGADEETGTEGKEERVPEPAAGGTPEAFALPADAELLEELCEIRYGLASTGAIRIEPKDALRLRLSRSTDRADALALTFADAGYDPGLTVL